MAGLACLFMAMQVACGVMEADRPRSDSDQSGALLARNKYSLQQYESLQPGMSYSQVTNVMGAEGGEAEPGDLADASTVLHRWRNANGSYTSAIFKDDALIGKIQVGLE